MRFVTFFLISWALAGCSMTRFAYDNADAYLRWRAASYLDVRGEAVDELDERIDSFLDWHRAQALPQYARIAHEASARLGDGLSPADLVWGYDAFMAQTRQGARAAAERIAPMLDRLTPAQLAHMQKQLERENRKFARDNLRGSEQERRRRRADRVIDRLEDWVGTLSQAQIGRVRQYSERAPLVDELRDRDRKRVQAEILAMVRARDAQKLLPERMANWDQGRDPAYAAASAAARQEFQGMLLDIDRTLAPAQRATAVAQFRRYAQDFQALAGRVP